MIPQEHTTFRFRDDLLLLANGANIVAMQSYDNLRGYFENALADSITNRKKFRSGLNIHDISRPAEMKEIAFLEMRLVLGSIGFGGPEDATPIFQRTSTDSPTTFCVSSIWQT